MLKNAFVLFVYSFVTLVVKHLTPFSICRFKTPTPAFSLQSTNLRLFDNAENQHYKYIESSTSA